MQPVLLRALHSPQDSILALNPACVLFLGNSDSWSPPQCPSGFYDGSNEEVNQYETTVLPNQRLREHCT